MSRFHHRGFNILLALVAIHVAVNLFYQFVKEDPIIKAMITGEKPVDPLTLLFYPAQGTGESTIYEDAGDGFGYEQGEYARRNVSCETSEDRIAVRLGERGGSFVPERREVRVGLCGIAEAQGVLVDGEQRGLDLNEDGTLIVSLGEEAGATTVEVIL